MGTFDRLSPTARSLIAELIGNEAKTIEARRDGKNGQLVLLALERQKIFAAITEAYPQLTTERIEAILNTQHNQELVKIVVDNRKQLQGGSAIYANLQASIDTEAKP